MYRQGINKYTKQSFIDLMLFLMSSKTKKTFVCCFFKSSKLKFSIKTLIIEIMQKLLFHSTCSFKVTENTVFVITLSCFML